MSRLQEVLRKYQVLSEQPAPPTQKEKCNNEVETRFSTVNRKIGVVAHVIYALKIKFIEYEDILERVNIMANDDICNNCWSVSFIP